MIEFLQYKSKLAVLGIMFWCIVFTATVFAQTPTQIEAIAIFDRVQAGEMSAKTGLSDLADIGIENNDPVLLAVQGSLLTLRADEVFLPFRKLKFVNEGLDDLDKAANMVTPSDPGFLRVYMFAAIGSASVPKFLNRDGFALRYFEKIAEHPDFDKMGQPNVATVYAWMAKIEGVETKKGKVLAIQAMEIDIDAAQGVLGEN